MIITDKISKISNLWLYHIHLWLVEVFGFSDNQTFAGLSVVAVGNICQLPPARQTPVYAEYNNH